MRWWQAGVIYQVYPRSLQDSNGDGVGDLRGVLQRLPYLVDLGVSALWLSPVFTSPMVSPGNQRHRTRLTVALWQVDFGYDISDYCGIDPIFGTLADFDALVAAAHDADVRVILDLVPCHTSDQHAWFKSARASRDSPHRDWYIWRDAKEDGALPNNWLSHFGGSVWEWDAATQQYYMHSFVREQPDLNWRNRDVQRAMFDVMRFWLRRGVDGFRVDVMHGLYKHRDFLDEPLDPRYKEGDNPHDSLEHIYTENQPETFETVLQMRRVLEEFGPDRLLIGEVYVPLDVLIKYYGPNSDGAHLPFNFSLIFARWNAPAVKAIVDKYELALPADAWPNWCMSNHDTSRIATRIGVAQSRVAHLLLLTLRGTPTCYQGDEIGLRDVPIPPELEQDPRGRNMPGLGLGRDPERTPMHWSGTEPSAGFTSGTPWLPLASDWMTTNVASQQRDPTSFLSFFKHAVRLRTQSTTLLYGPYVPVTLTDDEANNVFAFARSPSTTPNADRDWYIVLLNLTSKPQRVQVPVAALLASSAAARFSSQFTWNTHMDRSGPVDVAKPLPLRENEGAVIRLTPVA